MNKLMISLLFVPCVFFADTFYVGGDGASDSGSGSAQNPWASLRKAAGAVKAGDTVMVAPGNYPEAVVIAVSGTESEPVTFRAEPARQAKVKSFKLDGDFITIEGFDISNNAEDGFGVFCGEAHRKTARTGCKILNNYLHDLNSTAITSGEHALIKDNTMRNVNRGVFLNSYSLFENNEIDRLIIPASQADKPKKTQYIFFVGQQITIRGNYLHGTPMEDVHKLHTDFFTTYDAWVFGPSNDILIENNRCFNTMHACEPSANALKQSSRITFRNNLLVDTVYVGIYCQNFSHITVENNTFVNCGAYPVWFQTPRETEGSVVRNNLMTTWKHQIILDRKKAEAAVRVNDDIQSRPVVSNNMMWVYYNRPNLEAGFVAEPQFVDPDNYDFRLKPGSPGEGIGMNLAPWPTK